jgi:hypothetical protein
MLWYSTKIVRSVFTKQDITADIFSIFWAFSIYDCIFSAEVDAVGSLKTSREGSTRFSFMPHQILFYYIDKKKGMLMIWGQKVG